jgi:opacity protein-like surface antigen
MERSVRKQILVGTALLIGATGSALAAEGVSYSYLEGGYGYTDVAGSAGGGHADELSIGGSAAFGENLFGFGHVSTWDYSGFKATYLALGVGFHAGISDSVDFVTGLSFELADPEGGGSDTGFGLSAGLRGMATENLELSGEVEYTDFGGGADGMTFSVGGRYYFTETFAAGLDVSMDDEGDSTTIGLSLRYAFGR